MTDTVDSNNVIELARHVAMMSNSPEAQRLLELIGTDGDPHEANQRHPSGETGTTKPPKCSLTIHQIEEPPVKDSVLKHDVCFCRGRGVYISQSQFGTWKYDHDRNATIPASQKIRFNDSFSFIDEHTILGLAREIKAAYGMARLS